MVVGDLAVSIPPLPTFQVSQVGQMALGEKLGNNAAREREREREEEARCFSFAPKWPPSYSQLQNCGERLLSNRNRNTGKGER